MMNGAGTARRGLARPRAGAGSPPCQPAAPSQRRGHGQVSRACRHSPCMGISAPSLVSILPPPYVLQLSLLAAHPLTTLSAISPGNPTVTAVPESFGQSQPTAKTLFISSCSYSATEAAFRAFCVLAL